LPVAIGNGAPGLRQSVPVPMLRPTLISRRDDTSASTPPRRTKIWEFSTNLHCSIIGTCLSTSDLRQVLKKFGCLSPDSSEHELHAAAVSLAGQHDKPAKLLNKALDERHRLAINRFAKAASEAALRALWTEALRNGDIPGGYWATLTHPAATRELVRDAFNDVHMLSHLVGAANRADIRRLRDLEADNAELRARLDRQQAAMHDAIVSCDARIRELQRALAQQIASGSAAPSADGDTLRSVVAELERRVAAEARRNAALHERLEAADAALNDQRSARMQAEREAAALHHELDLIEAAALAEGCEEAAPPQPRLDGMTLLYIGGRPNQICHLRSAAERAGAGFLHHDGGVEHHLNLLPGLASQADLVLFPVDCISHHAALAAKALCRQTGKRFVPLRSAGVTSLLAALRRPEIVGVAEAAD
jgi:hypothetical protein